MNVSKTVTNTHAGGETPVKRLAMASAIGTIIEAYDFVLYGTVAALVFDKLFFPNVEPVIATLASFATFGVGFLARPVGGVIFGHFGDKFGRKNILIITLVMMGGVSFLIGLLPTQQTIGMAAPILLVTLRIIQGFAVGGEWAGAALMSMEHAAPKGRGFAASIVASGGPSGAVLATMVLTAFSVLPDEQFLAWGWRVAFWFSAVVVLIGYWIRTSVDDAPIFKEAQARQAQKAEQQLGVVEVLRHHWRAVLVGIGARFAENILYYTVVTFSITYLKLVVHKDTSQILLLMFGAHLLHFFLIPLMGYLSDLVGRKPVYLTGAVLTAFWGFIGFPMMDTGNNWLIMAAITLGLAIESMTYAPYSALMAELFPTHVRYTALSLCYQVAPIFAGSLAPLIAITLLNKYHSSTPIAWYLVGAALISIVAVGLTRETRGKSLHAVDAEAAARIAAGQAAPVRQGSSLA